MYNLVGFPAQEQRPDGVTQAIQQVLPSCVQLTRTPRSAIFLSRSND